MTRRTMSVAGGLLVGLLLAAGVIAQSRDTASQWDGVFTDVQAQRGAALYKRHCEACHATDLRGVSRAVDYPGMSPFTPALVGDEFVNNWAGLSLGDLSERIRISMPQGRPGSLTRQQVADVLAYLLQFAGYRSGVSELPASVALLSTIMVTRSDRRSGGQ